MPPEEYSYMASILRLLRNRPFILLILTYGGWTIKNCCFKSGKCESAVFNRECADGYVVFLEKRDRLIPGNPREVISKAFFSSLPGAKFQDRLIMFNDPARRLRRSKENPVSRRSYFHILLWSAGHICCRLCCRPSTM